LHLHTRALAATVTVLMVFAAGCASPSADGPSARSIPDNLDETLEAGQHTFVMPTSETTVTINVDERLDVAALNLGDRAVNAGLYARRDGMEVLVSDFDGVFSQDGLDFEMHEVPGDLVRWFESDPGANEHLIRQTIGVEIPGWETYAFAAKAAPEWIEATGEYRRLLSHQSTGEEWLELGASDNGTVYVLMRRDRRSPWIAVLAETTDSALLQQLLGTTIQW
jgi:hypothetical protein